MNIHTMVETSVPDREMNIYIDSGSEGWGTERERERVACTGNSLQH